jgi:hypothetical protein
MVGARYIISACRPGRKLWRRRRNILELLWNSNFLRICETAGRQADSDSNMLRGRVGHLILSIGSTWMGSFWGLERRLTRRSTGKKGYISCRKTRERPWSLS